MMFPNLECRQAGPTALVSQPGGCAALAGTNGWAASHDASACGIDHPIDKYRAIHRKTAAAQQRGASEQRHACSHCNASVPATARIHNRRRDERRDPCEQTHRAVSHLQKGHDGQPKEARKKGENNVAPVRPACSSRRRPRARSRQRLRINGLILVHVTIAAGAADAAQRSIEEQWRRPSASALATGVARPRSLQ
jgi:hypothetical protein